MPVYFLQSEREPGTKGIPPVKIGSTRGAVKNRVRNLQTASPSRLAIIRLLEGAGREERLVHDALGHLRITKPRGEWFRFDPIILNHDFGFRDLPLPDPELWDHVMVTACPEDVAAFLRAIKDGPRAFSTLAVYNALAPYVRRDTGELFCTQRALAETASVELGDVSRALARLVELGALQKAGRGRYAVNPRFVWRGELAKREEAEKAGPRLVKAP